MHPYARNDARPFGAHLDLSVGRSLLVIALPPLAMIAIQIAFFQFANALTGDSGEPDVLGPAQLLAVNLSMIVAGFLTVPFVARFARTSWRNVLSYPRSFDVRRLRFYFGWAALLTLCSNAAVGAFAPERTPWIAFGMTRTTMALVAIVILTTPMTAAAEQLMFRGAIMPAAASWVKPVRLALAVGVLTLSMLFALTHLSADLWVFSYHIYLGLCMALMAVRSGGLEAPIVFHVGNNTVTALVNTLLSGGGFALYRGDGAGGPYLLLPAAFVAAMLVLVWVREGPSFRDKRWGHRGNGRIPRLGPAYPVPSDTNEG